MELQCPRSRGQGEGRPGSRHQEAEDRQLLDRVEWGAGEAPAQASERLGPRGPEYWGQTLLRLVPGADLVSAPMPQLPCE